MVFGRSRSRLVCSIYMCKCVCERVCLKAEDAGTEIRIPLCSIWGLNPFWWAELAPVRSVLSPEKHECVCWCASRYSSSPQPRTGHECDWAERCWQNKAAGARARPMWPTSNACAITFHSIPNPPSGVPWQQPPWISLCEHLSAALLQCAVMWTCLHTAPGVLQLSCLWSVFNGSSPCATLTHTQGLKCSLTNGGLLAVVPQCAMGMHVVISAHKASC